MSRLTDLISQVKANDPEIGKELEREFKALASRRSFGLNFERHRPESVELPGRPVRKGDKVRVLPPRSSTEKGDQRLWKVRGFERVEGKRSARIELIGGTEPEAQQVAVEDLVVVAASIDELVANYLKISKSSLYKLAQSGKALGRKIGWHWRFHKEAIDQWFKESKRPDANGAAK